ncbi:hypothetical protein [Burkholderia lata]|nr:hypothetical protein [Burkholderia lata]
MTMIWHERTHDDPAYGWLRRQVAEIAQDMAPRPSHQSSRYID